MTFDPDEVQRRLGDPDRRRALARAALADSPAREPFDRLARLAARLLGAPVALVSIVDGDGQYFAGAVGLAEPWATRRATPLSHSFCQYVVSCGEALAVGDAREHDVLRDSPAVRELGVIAYLGMPLCSPDGHVLGSLCAIAHEPRRWRADEHETLRDLCASAASEVHLRILLREALETVETERRWALELNDDLIQRLTAAKLSIDLGTAEDATAEELGAGIEAARATVGTMLARGGGVRPGGLRRTRTEP